MLLFSLSIYIYRYTYTHIGLLWPCTRTPRRRTWWAYPGWHRKYTLTTNNQTNKHTY